MATIETVYEGGLRTRATHMASREMLVTDAPVDNRGRGEAFSPTDLLSASLGSCMLTIMGIAAESHQLNLEGTRVEITKVMAANPRRVAEIHVEFFMPPHSFGDHARRILEKAAETCPVALSLHPDLKQVLMFNW